MIRNVSLRLIAMTLQFFYSDISINIMFFWGGGLLALNIYIFWGGSNHSLCLIAITLQFFIVIFPYIIILFFEENGLLGLNIPLTSNILSGA